jgi:D-xylose 1-dehydrogenase (NADP+, D-xylono-1,5-lactone-forming)
MRFPKAWLTAGLPLPWEGLASQFSRMANEKIRWGVLGYARIARETVIPAILRAANSELHAVASRDAAKLAECRARYPGPKGYVGYEELLRDPEVNAVYIPLPNSLHREWTLKAAERGKHVLCEKPLGLDAAECREMIAACAANGVRLMEAFMYRYTTRTRLVREILRSGVLGEIRQVNSCFRFFLTNPASIKLKPELGGGALYDVGCYGVNFIGMVVDEIARAAGNATPESPREIPPVSVAVECARTGGVDLNLSALLRYDSGLIGTVHCGLDSHRRVFSEIIGTLGVLEIPDTFFDNAGVLTLTTGGDQRREIPVEASDRYRLEVEDFAGAVLRGTAPALSLDESLRNAGVMDRIFAASRRPIPTRKE